MKNMKSLVAFVLLAIAHVSSAQELPSFSGETLEKKTIHVPDDLRGRYSFLCFASSTKAQKALESWLDPVYNKFIAKTGLMDEFYDVNVFFIPVFKGANKNMQQTVRKKFDETAQQDVRGNVLFCQSELSAVIDALHMENESTPYFFLLDPEGKIIYRTTGYFSETKFDEIDDLI